jgi:ribonuclease T2
MIRALLAAALLLLPTGAFAAPTDVGQRPPGAFAYYVLTLSWEPGFCATTPGHDAECRAPRGFVLHGLWPQLDRNAYPSSCSTRLLPESERRQWAHIYADPAMIDHEWDKHGTCSGLAPAAYFQLSQSQAAKIVIPADYTTGTRLGARDIPAIKQAFVAANPGLTSDGIWVEIKSRVVTGIEFCLTKDGAFRSC